MIDNSDSYERNRKMAKYILFDLDGTLTDPKGGITKSVQYALRKFEITVDDPDSLTNFIGPPLKNSFKGFYGFDDEDAESAVTEYRKYFSEKGIYENAIFDGIDEMLKALRDAGKTIILATSKPRVYAGQILKHFNIYDYFTFVSGSELDGSRTEKYEVIKYALEQNNITDLSSVVMVGDREHDILGAKKMGVASIGVLFGYGDYAELSDAGADVIVSDVAELKSVLQEF
jgi:haloacid dehalogenase superfamily, subfamily IA, variant 1 with third motif having Dx(3-4)D or Dx(3-4)E